MDIKGKTIILTGGKRIGKTVAHFLAQKGANLAVTYRESQEDANEICEDAKSLSVKAVAFKADVSREEEINQLVESVKKEFGQIDGLVHMAAPYPKNLFGEITMADIELNLHAITASTILLVQALTDELKKNNGKVVLFSDWASNKQPYKDYLPYHAAKGSIETLTRALAVELAPEVTVNCVAPGPILRPPDLTDEENKEVLAGTPLTKWGGPEEIAKAVLYLLDADFVTGVILPVDGGRSIV
ncbi:SDR family oxidoreductase [Candidatus Microgenomates bacterium]|nr:SDR family oxidoreductase [Candidatus Microgenomates bacterium]